MRKALFAGVIGLILLPALAGAVDFRQIRIPYAKWPRCVDDFAVVDLNRDGIADIVTLEGDWEDNPSLLKVFLGDRAAAFKRTFTQNIGYFKLKPPIAAAGDLTGDKKADLAFKSYYGDSIVIFPGKGNGSLLPMITVKPAGSNIMSPTHWIGAFDLNGDNKLDLAGINTSDSITVLRNLGSKKFSATVFGQAITSLAGGDIGKDKADDLLAASGGTLRYYKSNRDGTFGSPVVTRLGENAGPHLEAADLNGDGRLDLVGDGQSAGRPGWTMLGKADGKFGPKKILPTKPSLHYGFVVADLTVDKKKDIAAPGSKAGLDVFRGLGSGAFAVEGKLGGALNFAGNAGTANSARNIACGDVNGDKKTDLVALVQFPGDPFMTPTILVFLNGLAQVAPTISNLVIDSLYYDGSVHMSGHVDFSHPAGDMRNSGWDANDGAFVEYTIKIDFSGDRRDKTIRTSTNHSGETQGTIYFNIKISDNTYPGGTPTLSVMDFSVYDYHFVQSNVLL